MLLEKNGRIYNVELMVNKDGVWTAKKTRKKRFRSIADFESWCEKWDRHGFIVNMVELDPEQVFDYTPLVTVGK